MLDYARIYGLRTIVFRQSCIYGTQQYGSEDQGWVVHFVLSAKKGRPVKIFGNGKQVRDILYISDLVSAVAAAVDHIEVTTGQVYNIGGSMNNRSRSGRNLHLLFRRLPGGRFPLLIIKPAQAISRFTFAIFVKQRATLDGNRWFRFEKG